jgi:hypothetical protein
VSLGVCCANPAVLADISSDREEQELVEVPLPILVPAGNYLKAKRDATLGLRLILVRCVVYEETRHLCGQFTCPSTYLCVIYVVFGCCYISEETRPASISQSLVSTISRL